MISPLAHIETDQIGANTTVHEYAIIRKNVKIGENVVIHPFVVIEEGVTIGSNTEIFPGSYIGKIPKGAGATARQTSYNPRISIGSDCAIGPNAVIFYDVEIGDHTLIGDGASLREQCSVGHHCIISRYVTLNYNAHVGNHTRIMDLTHITGNSTIGDNVFISVHVSTVNDNVVVAREYHEERIQGPTLENNVTIGAGAILLPSTHIGEGAFVGSGAVVTKDLPPRVLALGIPAKIIKEI
jgi:acetyltransferase-like isoleucine patch superfamily enzyme